MKKKALVVAAFVPWSLLAAPFIPKILVVLDAVGHCFGIELKFHGG